MGIREFLVPGDTLFFDLFERQAGLLKEAAWQLVDLTEDFTHVREKCHVGGNPEHKGDQTTHDIYQQLKRTFITPLDPGEISRPASTPDEVPDSFDGSAGKMLCYPTESTNPPMIELAKLIHRSTGEIESAVKSLRSIKDPGSIEERCIEVNRPENPADDVPAHAITDLFRTTDTITITNLKGIDEHLEMTTDNGKDGANTLSDIAIRPT